MARWEPDLSGDRGKGRWAELRCSSLGSAVVLMAEGGARRGEKRVAIE